MLFYIIFFTPKLSLCSWFKICLCRDKLFSEGLKRSSSENTFTFSKKFYIYKLKTIRWQTKQNLLKS